MLLRLKKHLPGSELDAILARAKDLGYQGRFLDSAKTLLELERSGPGKAGDRAQFEDCAGIVAVLDSSDAPQLWERASGRPETQVKVGQALFGRGKAALIAGPCAVEGERELLAIAHAVRKAGAAVLRGGAFKPRSSPYSFQGLGERALELLAQARAETGLALVTEVLDTRDIGAVEAVTDMFQIGSRSMANTPLLIEVGKTRKPVLLKRGMSATAREFLLAAEYVLAQGNEQVVLCERGVRSFDSITRNLLDVGAIAWLKGNTHLPVIADPSHAAGYTALVPAMARAGLAAGADGLIVEVHSDPSSAHSDGAQAVAPETFERMVADARVLLRLDGKTLTGVESPAAAGAGT